MRIVGHRILVDSDVGAAQRGVSGLAGQAPGDQINQKQMVVGAAGHNGVAAFDEGPGHDPGIGDHLFLVVHELRLQRLQQGHRFGGDDVHQRPTLGAGEHQGVEFLFEVGIGAGQNQTAAWAAQGFMGGGGHHIGDRDRIGINARRDQSGHMGHVHEQIGPDLIGDGAEPLPVHHPRIGRKAGDDHFGPAFQRQPLDLGVVNFAGGLIQPVLHRLIEPARKVDLGAVGQMAAVGQAHAEDGFARLDQRHVYRRVGL